MKKLVIFDLDGTLLNTITDLGTAANYALEQNGYPTHNIASYPFFVGNGTRRLLERVLPEDYRKQTIIDQLMVDFKDYYNQHSTENTLPYKGIPELLETLQEKGVAIAIASNKYQSATEHLISHFFPQIKFAAIEGQKDDIPVKPDPSVVFQILSKVRVPKAEVLYVGDSGVDIETARRACVSSVGVTWGFRPEKELVDYHANVIVNDPRDILDVIDTFLV